MKKILPKFAGIVLITFLLLTACAPAEGGLSGSGGRGATEPPVTGGDEGAGQPNQPPSGGGGNSGPSNSGGGGQKPVAERFYLPKLTIVLSKDSSSYVPGLSTSPMGTADYQLTAPMTLPLGMEGTIELIVVPDWLNVEKTRAFEAVDQNVMQAFQGALDIYPYMSAEINAGESFSITPDNLIDQIILDYRSTIWLWHITARQPGEHKIIVTISVPAEVDEIQSAYEMARIEFDVSVAQPAPQAEAAPRNMFTTTSMGEISVQMLAVIAAIITLVAAIIPLRKRGETKRKTRAEQNQDVAKEKAQGQSKEISQQHKRK